MVYCVLDLETTSKEVYKRVANPFYNTILCIGLKYQNKKVVALPQDYMIANWLENVSVLIGHNIKFDLLYLWKNTELQQFFNNGGRIWCTQLAEYILSGQRHKYPALRDIAVNKYGCQSRIKYIEQGFENGLDTSQIDMNLLLEDVQNDVLDTEQVMLQQVLKAKQLGMFNLIQTQMDSLLATTEMEYNGVCVDSYKLEVVKNGLLTERTTKIEQLLTLIGKYWHD